MNWHINHESDATVVVLDRAMGIQDAAAFYDAVLAVAVTGGDVRLDAGAAKSVHSSIMQILYALSQAVAVFRVTAASADFLAAEIRVGFSLVRHKPAALASNAPAGVEVSGA
jgi:hypothetical protein